jgi:hypothetical protein
MKWVGGIAIAAAVVLGLALFLALDAIVERPEVRAAIEGLGEAALGRSFQYEKLEVGLFPPRVVIVAPVFAGTDGVVALSAERVAAPVALLPMLAGDVVIQGIMIRGGNIALVRSDEGLLLAGEPVVPLPEVANEAELSTREQTERLLDRRGQAIENVEESSGAKVQIRRVRIANTRLSFTDRTLVPPLELSLEGLRGDASFPKGDEPGPLDLHALLGGDAAVAVTGKLSLEGDAALHFELEDVPLLLLRRFLAEGSQLEGTTDMAGDLALAGWSPTSLAADLHGRNVVLGVGEASFAGELPVSLDTKPVDGQLAGTFSLDATQMRLENSDFFAKPVGDPLTVQGRIRLLEGGGLELRGDELHAGPATGRLDLTTEPRLRTVLDAPPFDVGPFLRWFPGLSDFGTQGRLGAEALALTFGPLTVDGAVEIDGLALPLEAGAESRLDGRLVGAGNKIRGEDLVLRIADQPISADLAVDLAPGGEVVLDFLGDDLSTGAILDAFGAPPGMLTGPAHLDGAFRLPREGERQVLERLRGHTRLEIGSGRWKGVSFLEQIFGAMSAIAKPLLALGRAEGGRDVQRFYGDEFETISGTFTVSDGVATTDDLKLEYRSYVVDLDGDIGLVDQSLDMTGKLTMLSELDEAVAGTLGTNSGHVSRTIPLAGVKGTLQDPKVTVADHAVRAFLAGVLLSDQGRGLRKTIDETLGEHVGNVFEALIGGKGEEKEE